MHNTLCWSRIFSHNNRNDNGDIYIDADEGDILSGSPQNTPSFSSSFDFLYFIHPFTLGNYNLLTLCGCVSTGVISAMFTMCIPRTMANLLLTSGCNAHVWMIFVGSLLGQALFSVGHSMMASLLSEYIFSSIRLDILKLCFSSQVADSEGQFPLLHAVDHTCNEFRQTLRGILSNVNIPSIYITCTCKKRLVHRKYARTLPVHSLTLCARDRVFGVSLSFLDTFTKYSWFPLFSP